MFFFFFLVNLTASLYFSWYLPTSHHCLSSCYYFPLLKKTQLKSVTMGDGFQYGLIPSKYGCWGLPHPYVSLAQRLLNILGHWKGECPCVEVEFGSANSTGVVASLLLNDTWVICRRILVEGSLQRATWLIRQVTSVDWCSTHCFWSPHSSLALAKDGIGFFLQTPLSSK